MSQEASKGGPVRKIAQDLLKKIFRKGLAAEVERDLITSLVRQWIGYEGHAALFTGKDRFWFTLTRQPEGITNVEVNHIPQSPLDDFLKDWRIAPEKAADLVHRLNLCQTAEVRNRDGERLRFMVDPLKRTIQIEPSADVVRDEG
jgi:hypothetical protein